MDVSLVRSIQLRLNPCSVDNGTIISVIRLEHYIEVSYVSTNKACHNRTSGESHV